MSGYSANQYESAFKSQRLQNWCVPKRDQKRPNAQGGHTAFIANDRGHLLPEVAKKGSAWPDFKGTWDLPARLPASRINPTSRSAEGRRRLESWGLDPQHPPTSQPRTGSKNTPESLANAEPQQQGVAPSSKPPSRNTTSAAEARPVSQNKSVTLGERPASHSQQSHSAAEEPVAQPTGERPASSAQADGKNSPLTQRSQIEERPSTRPATGEERPMTGKGNPGSEVSERAVKTPQCL